MSKRDEHQKGLFRPVLDQIIDMKHPLVMLAGKSTGASLGVSAGAG